MSKYDVFIYGAETYKQIEASSEEEASASLLNDGYNASHQSWHLRMRWMLMLKMKNDISHSSSTYTLNV